MLHTNSALDIALQVKDTIGYFEMINNCFTIQIEHIKRIGRRCCIDMASITFKSDDTDVNGLDRFS